MFKANIHLQNQGSVFIVGISSDKDGEAGIEEIEEQYNSFYNYGATDGELYELSDRFKYIWTTPDKLARYLKNSSIAYLRQQKGNVKFKGAREEIKKIAEARIKQMIKEDFLKFQINDVEPYKVSNPEKELIYDEEFYREGNDYLPVEDSGQSGS